MTKRVRRIFSWSRIQYAKFLRMCQPTDISLNFANYLDDRIAGHRGHMTRTYIRRNYPKVDGHLSTMVHQASNELRTYAPIIALLGTGPANEEMVEIDG